MKYFYTLILLLIPALSLAEEKTTEQPTSSIEAPKVNANKPYKAKIDKDFSKLSQELQEEIKEFRKLRKELDKKKSALYKGLSKEAKDFLAKEREIRKSFSTSK